ncbi:MAG: AAA family ATPase [Paludibacteraceae bacterium]|nr:AAA family ATPase [Paludibacteraceae bacterium]
MIVHNNINLILKTVVINMILGIILRNFKIYKSISYIPISNGNRFCGLIGKNGIGKSSILEALDYYFNSNNKGFKKSNTGTPKSEECYVVPVFCISTKIVHDDFAKHEDDILALSNSIWDVVNDFGSYSTQINTNYTDLIQQFYDHIAAIKDVISREDYCLLPIGRDIDGNVSLGFFKDGVFINRLVDDEKAPNAEQKQKILQEKYLEVFNSIIEYYQYVFIPKDIEPENLVRFETLELQTLLNTNLNSIISKYLTKQNILEISSGLKTFVDELSSKLPNYKFKAPTSNQPNLKPDKIYNLIVQDFFSLRQLHKEGKNGGKDLALKELSSGEKQQAILTLIHSIVSEYRSNNTKNLIIAVDEPESSLHISACYEQFEKLYEISNICCQILISSHWYGFIPAIPNGTITNITYSDSRNKGHIFNIHKYREEIKHQTRDYAQEYHSQLPIDISLKSSNDFIQSILMSVISNDSYNWLICEGSSDKIYLEAYLQDEITNKRLRIVPVCTASEVKNTYNRLQVLFDELRQGSQLKGKVFLLTDTDTNPLEFNTQENLETHLLCRRIVNIDNNRNTVLVKINSGPKAPNTDIEDALNGIAFQKALLDLKNNGYETELKFISETEEAEDIPSYYALDLKQSQKTQLDTFFNGNNGNNKVLFANKYVEIMKAGNYSVPNWILEIKNFFN